MGDIQHFFGVIAEALLHSLWQGMVVWLLVILLQAVVPRCDAATKSWLALLGVLGMLLWFVVTIISLNGGIGSGSDGPGLLSVGVTGELLASHWIASAWFVGVILLAVRTGFSYLKTQSLARHNLTTVPSDVMPMVGELCEKLGLRRRVRLVASSVAQVPMVIGVFRPVVVLPSYILISLSESELRAIVAHELAHIKRGDHWLNAMMCLAEVLLFFHPFIWWAAKVMRSQREYHCDALAVDAGVDNVSLARALMQIETSRSIIAAAQISSQGGKLKSRIARILQVHSDTIKHQRITNMKNIIVTISLATLAVAGLSVLSADEQAVEKYKPEIEAAVKNGKITRAQADEKYAWLRKHGEVKEKGDKAAIEAAVRSGKLTREQAEKKYEYLKIQAAFAEAKEEIKGALKSGEISDEQAKEKYEVLAKKWKLMKEGKQMVKPKLNEKQLNEMIDRALEMGKITPEEADLKRKAIKKPL